MSDRSLNILIVTSWFPNKHSPTEGSFVWEQAALLSSKGHNVTVLHTYLLGNFKSSFGKKCRINLSNDIGIKILTVGVPAIFPGLRFLSYYHCFQTCIKGFKRFSINITDFDLVHSHAAFMGGYVAMKLSFKYNIPQFHTEHASGLIFNPTQYTLNDQKILRNIYDHSKMVLFVSDFARNEICKNFKISKTKNIDILPNLVANIFFNGNILKPSFPFKYLIIGNFIPVKNHNMLLQAWAEFQNRFPEAQLSLVGEGPLLKDIKCLVSELNLKNIIFFPRQGRNGVLIQIRNHHIIISSSQVETFGLTIAEAQAMGKPVVVTDSGGVRDIVEPETGIVTEKSVESLLTGLITIQNNFFEFNPNEIREKTFKKFSEEIIYTRLIKLYKTVLN